MTPLYEVRRGQYGLQSGITGFTLKDEWDFDSERHEKMEETA